MLFYFRVLDLIMSESMAQNFIEFSLLRSEGLITAESLTQDFCSFSKPAPYLIRGRSNRRIAGYATVATTRKTDKKTSQDPGIIKSSLLNIRRP